MVIRSRVVLWAVIMTGLVMQLGAQQTPAGMRKEAIDDPTLGMAAFDVYVPAKWHFAGRMIQGTSCSPISFPVFRATSPDGLTVLERMPRVDWKWGNGPGGSTEDCLPLKKELTAREMLHYMADVLKVEYVADDPLPADVTAANNRSFEAAKAANAAKYRGAGMIPPEENASQARAIVRYRNGSFKMKGQLSGSVYCSTNLTRAFGGMPALEMHGCTGNIRYVHAPDAQFEAAVKMLEPAGASQRAEWMQAWTQRSNQQAQAGLNSLRAQGEQNAAQRKASHDQFMQSQATRQKMHQDFMASMQREGEQPSNRWQQNMNARSTTTSNWVDYALDQQTVRDPGTGQVNKVSSQYSYTWVNGSGMTSYQTNDPNANPNGSLTGTWTRQQVVNGDGTSN